LQPICVCAIANAMQTDGDAVPAPPVGFRKAIPVTVRLDVVIRLEGRCKACGERLGKLADTEFDHVPALQLRGWDVEAGDTIPPANDPEHIQAKHVDCHKAKTTGRKGESKLNALHGDTAEIAKLRRVTKSEIEFRRRLLAKGEPETDADERPKPKSRWPKRPFNRGGKRGPSGSRSSGRAELDGEVSSH